jgi:hypothetical protein
MAGAPLTAEEDDAVIAPAPESEVFVHPHAPAVKSDAGAVVRRMSAASKSVAFKQTTIPILFTVAVLATITGAVELIVPAESPLAPPVPWAPWALFAAGGIFFAIAAMNVLMSRAELAALPKVASRNDRSRNAAARKIAKK